MELTIIWSVARMKLPECSTCNYQFKWKELSIFSRRKKCPQCGNFQYITTHSGWKIGAIGVVAAFLLIFIRIYSFYWSLFLGTLFFIVFIAIVPYYIELTDEEQPLF